MPSTWAPVQLRAIESAHAREITTIRHDGPLRPWVPIWVVRVGADRVDRAYRDKYGSDGGSVGRMTGEEAAASTLRFSPAEID